MLTVHMSSEGRKLLLANSRNIKPGRPGHRLLRQVIDVYSSAEA